VYDARGQRWRFGRDLRGGLLAARGQQQ